MRSMTLICVVAMCAFAALVVCPTLAQEGLLCISKEPCPQGEFCVQYAGGDYNNFRSCHQPVGRDETCSWPGDAGIYVQFPPCEEGLKCGFDNVGYNGVSDAQSA